MGRRESRPSALHRPVRGWPRRAPSASGSLESGYDRAPEVLTGPAQAVQPVMAGAGPIGVEITGWCPPCAGHPRLAVLEGAKLWVAGPGPAMTRWQRPRRRPMISARMGRRPIGVEIMGRIAQIADTSRTKIAGASSLA